MEEESDISETSGASGEWTVASTGEDAAEAIVNYVFVDAWKIDHTSPRSAPMAVEVKEREGGHPSGKQISIFAWNAKTNARQLGPLPDALGTLIDDQLQVVPEPTKVIWNVFRGVLPELRDYDSSKTFHLVNAAYRAKLAPATSGHETGMMPPGVSIMAGRSPIGVNPAAPASGVSLTGDIGGTGLRDLVGAVTDAIGRMVQIVERNQTFTADLCARVIVHSADIAARSPNTVLEMRKLDVELAKKQMELDAGEATAKAQEVGGLARDLGGKALQSPAFAALGFALAKTMGVDPQMVMGMMGGENGGG